MAKRMNAAQLATEACDQGFQEGVRKMVEILLQGSTTPTEHKQAMQRFRKGLGIYKEAYASADSDEVARAFRDDVARGSEMMPPGVRCLAGG